MGSLNTCDPGDIFNTVNESKQLKVRCSVIGLAAEVHICKQMSTETKGLYSVILDEVHLHDVLQKIAFPLPNSDSGTQTLIKMGFPQHKVNKPDEISMCLCHLESEQCNISTGGYFCPICDNKYCELPVECKVCGLTLVMAPHLARSYHHLFPLEPYNEVLNDTAHLSVSYTQCYGCHFDMKDEKQVFECKLCKNIYCIECDIFIHETLHTCPSCHSNSNHLEQNNEMMMVQ
jgi:transcription initiation factor TFIIH subunit 2